MDLPGYLLRVTPGLVIVAVLYALLRGKQALPFRILIVVIGFLVVRDTLIVFHIWGYGLARGWLPWLRFVNEPILVLEFAVGSLLTTAFLLVLERDGWALLVWGRANLRNAAWGIAGGLLIAGPLAISRPVCPARRARGAVPHEMLWPLLAVAVFGNFTEDVLVRGYVQGYLGTLYSPVRAAIGSGLFYALGQVFVATTVTSLGAPIRCFVLYDGLVCAFVRMKTGLIPAAVSHGMAVAVLAIGLL